MKKQIYQLLSIALLLAFSSCSDLAMYTIGASIDAINLSHKQRAANSETYTGWWVYGEGHHVFKDEASLEEWALIFPNENLQDLENLYLSITEMEYFPMECEMHGNLKNDTLIVEDFEILYIQGCGE